MRRDAGAHPIDDSRDTPARKRILAVVAGLFAQQGYHAVGLAQIEKATGLTRGALYHHFASKEELLYDISVRYITALVASGSQRLASQASAVERVRELSRDLMQAVYRNKAEMTVCFREVESLTGDRRLHVSDQHLAYEAIWSRCVADGIADGTFRPVERLEIKALLGMYFYSLLWIRVDDPDGYREVADRFSALTLRALAA